MMEEQAYLDAKQDFKDQLTEDLFKNVVPELALVAVGGATGKVLARSLNNKVRLGLPGMAIGLHASTYTKDGKEKKSDAVEKRTIMRERKKEFKQSKQAFIADRMYLEKQAQTFWDLDDKKQDAFLKDNPSLGYYKDKKHDELEETSYESFKQKRLLDDARVKALKRERMLGAVTGGVIGESIGRLAVQGAGRKFKLPGQSSGLTGSLAGALAGSNVGANYQKGRFDKTNKELVKAHELATSKNQKSHDAMYQYQKEKGYVIE